MVSDTHAEAEKVQIELLRRAGVAGRIARMRSLTATAIHLSRRAIAEANPELTPRRFEAKCIELFYGKPLADELRRYWADRESDAAV